MPIAFTAMDWLNLSGSIASLIGLAVSFYTLYKVTKLPAALKQQSRDKQLSDLIDGMIRLPSTKPTIPDTMARELEAFLNTVRLYYVSSLPFRHRNLRSLLVALEEELKGQSIERSCNITCA